MIEIFTHTITPLYLFLPLLVFVAQKFLFIIYEIYNEKRRQSTEVVSCLTVPEGMEVCRDPLHGQNERVLWHKKRISNISRYRTE